MTQLPTKAAFVANLNATFSLVADDQQTIDVTLVELDEGRSSPQQEQFSIFFRGPGATPLGQGTYRLGHPTLGAFDLFIVPVGRYNDELEYQAVFNIQVKPGA
jgi:hypothetical protein